MMKQFLFGLFFILISLTSISQANHSITDPELRFKQAKEHFVEGDYALAYPLVKELLDKYSDNKGYSYLLEDSKYFYIVCGLKLLQETSSDDAIVYINSITNDPRKQLLSFHLAHYYFLKADYQHAIEYYDLAGYDN
ncbi:MAG: hypothetical protein ABIP69_00605, partial [Ferruginibacter sp.]